MSKSSTNKKKIKPPSIVGTYPQPTKKMLELERKVKKLILKSPSLRPGRWVNGKWVVDTDSTYMLHWNNINAFQDEYKRLRMEQLNP